MAEITLTRLTDEDREQFILDNQYAFKYGAMEEFGERDNHFEEDGEIISRKTIENSIDHGTAFVIRKDGKMVGGLVLKIDETTQHNELELLFVHPRAHSKGIGYAAWQEVERLYPDTKVWETCTPYFETRNIHFYVNKCGFHIVEFFNSRHPDPHDPETGEENNYEGEDFDGMFRFEKRMMTDTQALTQTYIKRLHYQMFYGTFDERRGKCRIGVYRTKSNNLEKLKAPPANDINAQMSKLIGEYERLPEVTLLQILDFHVRFERIRPFDDGNGRIGRLLMFKECLRHSVTPFILDDKRRSAYLEGLRLWDLDRSVLAAPCLEAQKRFENVIDTQHLLEEHHKQLLRDGFFRDKKRFEAEKAGNR